jgi:glycosyltransferase involved in cell wall biosynthesis
MIRILEVINTLSPSGGAESFASLFCKYMSKKSDLTVVVLYNQISPKFRAFFDKERISVIFLNKKKHFDIDTIKKLRAIIINKRIDIIHTENNGLLTSYFAVRHLKKKPLIFHTLHNPAQIECGGRVSRFLYKKIFRSKAAVPVGISSIISSGAKGFYHISECPTVFNGIEIGERPELKPLSERPFDCLIAARFEDQKNYPFVLDAFEKALDRSPNLKFVILGDGSQKAAIEKRLTSFPDGSIAFFGLSDAPLQYMNQSKVFFLGSKYEGNPMSVLESLSVGCIQVLTATGGVPDVVQDGVNGFLFPQNSLDLMASKICEIAACPDKFQPMSDANVARAVQFDFKVVSDRYLALFVNSLDQKKLPL